MIFSDPHLSDERKEQICKCENCGYKPLKHLEECPHCHSESYHLTIQFVETTKLEEKFLNE